MYEKSESILVPGTIVEHVEYPEWGQGQVQSCIKDTVTINFQNVGKKQLLLKFAKLSIVK